MKKYLISLVCASFLCTNGLYAGHLKDIFNNAKISNGAGGLKHQKAYWRDGGGHLGGYTAKWGSSSFNLVNIQPPHMKAGCNGIDIGWGGIDFISFDELKEKASQIMKNAQGYAFKLAISTLCKECEAVLSALEDVSNMINNMNFDTCELATKGVDSLFAAASGNSIADGKGSGWASEWAKGSKERANAITDFTNKWVGEAKGWISGDKNKNKALAFGYGSVLSNIYNLDKPKIFGINSYEDFYIWAALSLGKDILSVHKEGSDSFSFSAPLIYDNNGNYLNNIDVLDTSMKYLFDDLSFKGSINIRIYENHIEQEDETKETIKWYKLKKVAKINPIEMFELIKMYMSTNFYHVLGIMVGDNKYQLNSTDETFLNTFPNDMKDALNGIVYLNAIKDMGSDLKLCIKDGKDVATGVKDKISPECKTIDEQISFYVKEYTYELAAQSYLTFLDNLHNQLKTYMESDGFAPKDKKIIEAYEKMILDIENSKTKFNEKIIEAQDKIFKRKQEIRQQAAAFEAAKKKQAEKEFTDKLNGGQK